MKNYLKLFVFVLIFFLLSAFGVSSQKKEISQSELFKGIKTRSIGPATMSGRVATIAGVESNPDVFYIGAATGGVWKTVNGGITWKPVFDKQNVSSIGSIAIYQKNPNIVWVGTGEGNVRNSAGVGRGIYKSLDGGKTWKFLGLENTERIAKIILNPNNPDIAYVAALGKLWGENSERGVYKTTDGGKTWKKILFVDNKTGASDIAMAPDNPNKLFAAMWQFRRWPWFFKSGGPGSGLYLSTDAGETWKKITDKDGFPKGELGRIGVAFAKLNPNVVYALVESKKSGLYKSEDGGYKWKLINNKPGVDDRPFYYSKIFVNPVNENIIYTPQSNLKVSIDGGKNFKMLANFRQAHSDFHALWITPSGNRIITGDDGGIAISNDKGKHWMFVENLPLGQFYHISYDMELPYHVYGGLQDNGSWRGPAYVLDNRGIYNSDWKMVGFGDGFDTEPDPEKSYCGYAMSQGGEIFYYNTRTAEHRTIVPFVKDVKDRYNWNAGFAIDPLNPNIIYFGSQFLHKSKDKGRTWEVISPDLTTNDPSKLKQKESGGLTFDVTEAENFESIITISPSPVKEGVIWVGTDDGNLQLTTDGGKTWNNTVKYLVKKKMVPKGTWIPHVEASRFDAATAYVVFDNHRRSDWKTYIFVTCDYGKTWKKLATKDIDGFAHIIREDFKNKNLLFVGTEFGLYFSYTKGKDWIKWEGIPTVPVRDLAIQPRENDLIIGTHGRAIYIADDISPLREINKGVLSNDFYLFKINDAYEFARGWMPSSVSPGDGTFVGKNKIMGAYITYYINPKEIKNKKKESKKKGKTDKNVKKDKNNKVKTNGKISIKIFDSNNKVVRKLKGTMNKGINRVIWDLTSKGFKTPFSRGRRRGGGMPVLPGKYTVKIKYKDKEYKGIVIVKLDPRKKFDINVLKTNYKKAVEIGKWMDKITEAYKQLQDTRKLIKTILSNTKGMKKDKLKQIKTKAMKLDEKLENMVWTIVPKRGQQGIVDNSDVLMYKIYSVIGLINYEPLSQAFYAKYKKVKPEVQKFFKNYNGLYNTEVKDFEEFVKNSGFSLFKPFKKIDI
jgi:photosystem II stability/assembly factor-like uncharacterized protein